MILTSTSVGFSGSTSTRAVVWAVVVCRSPSTVPSRGDYRPMHFTLLDAHIRFLYFLAGIYVFAVSSLVHTEVLLVSYDFLSI
jgi:hypothetical protein